MKTVIVLSTLIAFATASAIPETRGLKEDLHEFVDVIPVDKFVDLAFRYVTFDKEFKEFLTYLKGQEFSAVWDQFFALKEVKDVLNDLQDAHLDVYDALNLFAEFLGLHHVRPTVKSLKAGGLCGFVDETLALLPLDTFQALFEEKVKTSPEFKAFYEHLHNLDFYKFVHFYNNSNEVQLLFQKLRNYGLNVDKFFDLVAGFFGWGQR